MWTDASAGAPPRSPRSLSIVVPAFDEQERIGPALDELIAYLVAAPPADLPSEIEVLVADDGSEDATAALVLGRPDRIETDRRTIRIRLLELPHAGKGAAVRSGMLAATGDARVFTDADLATPPDQLPLLLRALEASDVALGSRVQPDGRDLRATQPRVRRLLGRVFRWLAGIWVVGPVRDTQCGFKGFRRECADDLFARQRVGSIVFDVELIHLARRRGWTMTEVPVAWSDRRGSRMRIGARLASRVAWDLVRIPIIHAGDRRPGRTSGPSVRRLHRPSLPAFAGILVFLMVAGPIWAFMGENVGYDFDAYRAAAIRLLAHLPLYDAGARQVGPAGLFLYPPPFAVGMIPFALIPEPIATFLWVCLMAAAFLLAIHVMPVRARVREAILLCAAFSWPVHKAVELGQVEPLLLLLLSLGWRALARPGRLGALIAIGTLIKVRPAVLALWSLAHGRPRPALAAVAVVLLVTAATIPLTGLAAWTDYLALLGRVGDATQVRNAVTAGAVAWKAGATIEMAAWVQFGYVAATAAVLLAAIRFATAQGGYVVAAVVSQGIAPVLWDHSAIVLIIPVAYLMERGAWWSAALILATPLVLLGSIPDAIYPVALLLAPTMVLLADLTGARRDDRRPGVSSPA